MRYSHSLIEPLTAVSSIDPIDAVNHFESTASVPVVSACCAVALVDKRGTVPSVFSVSSSNIKGAASEVIVRKSQEKVVQSALLLRARYDLMQAQQNLAKQETLINDNGIVIPRKQLKRVTKPTVKKNRHLNKGY